MIQSILHEPVEVEFDEDGFSPTESVARLSRRPIAIILEEHNQALYGLLDYFWGINFDRNFRGRQPANSVSQEYVMLVANLVPKSHGSSNFVGINHEFIILFRRKVGAEFGTPMFYQRQLGASPGIIPPITLVDFSPIGYDPLMLHAAGI